MSDQGGSVRSGPDGADRPEVGLESDERVFRETNPPHGGPARRVPDTGLWRARAQELRKRVSLGSALARSVLTKQTAAAFAAEI
jgi:hypothetical protein